jgi:hypothetical protein
LTALASVALLAHCASLTALAVGVVGAVEVAATVRWSSTLG